MSDWNDDQEKILKTIGDKAFLMSEFHKNRYSELRDKLKFFKIPIIVFSGINSVIAVGMSNYMDQDTISMINCLLALICGIIGSIELYLKLAENMNIEYLSGRDFYLLHIDIVKTLALSRDRRGINGDSYLDDKFNIYTTLISNAQLMSGNEIKHTFDDIYISKQYKSSDDSSDSSDSGNSLLISKS